MCVCGESLVGRRIAVARDVMSVSRPASPARRPDDWTLSAGGSGTIYGWGHNHRGQLGGIEGAKVKVPTPTEALATLRPVQLIGGEQTLFAVTADGKVRALRRLGPMMSPLQERLGGRVGEGGKE